MRQYGDNFIPVIPTDDMQHTVKQPFCKTDPTCPCHEDQENIQTVAGYVQEGLITPDDATRIVQGKTL